MNSDQLLNRCPGLTYRMLDHWVRRGYLHPTSKGTGSGHSRTFPPDEVRVAQIMTQLVAVGMSPEAAHRAARAALAVDENDIPAVELAPGVTLVLGDIERLVPA